MSANLITGNLFKPIYAYQDADYQAGISGNVTSIMPVGSKMALSIEDANTIKADNGVLITKEGRRIQIDAGAIEEWSIPTGTQGQTNYYIVGFRLYTGDNSAELCETFVEKMENATDTIPENTFRSGATEVYISLGRVVQSGINLDSVTSLVQIAQSFEDIKNAIAQLNSDKAAKSEAIKNITRSGTTFTATRTDDTTFTFNQQDNYPTRVDTPISTAGYHGLNLWKFAFGNICIYFVDGTCDKNLVAGTEYDISPSNTTEPELYVAGINFTTRTIACLYKNSTTSNAFRLVVKETISSGSRVSIMFWYII